MFCYFPPYWFKQPPTESQIIAQNEALISGTDKPLNSSQSSHVSDSGASNNSLKEFLKKQSLLYGLDYQKLYYTVEHESGFDPYNIGPRGVSVGIAMYRLDTWLENCSDKDDRTNPYKSLNCMAQMWSLGLAYRWDAYCLHYWDNDCVVKRGLHP